MVEKQENRYTQFKLEPGEKQGEVTVDVQLTNAGDFMIASLLSIKLLAKKFDTDYETILNLMCAYLKDENISKEALKRVENDFREDGIENL